MSHFSIKDQSNVVFVINMVHTLNRPKSSDKDSLNTTTSPPLHTLDQYYPPVFLFQLSQILKFFISFKILSFEIFSWCSLFAPPKSQFDDDKTKSFISRFSNPRCRRVSSNACFTKLSRHQEAAFLLPSGLVIKFLVFFDGRRGKQGSAKCGSVVE